MDEKSVLLILFGVGIVGAIGAVLFLVSSSGGGEGGGGAGGEAVCKGVKSGASTKYKQGKKVIIKQGVNLYKGPCIESGVATTTYKDTVGTIESDSGYSYESGGAIYVYWKVGIPILNGSYWVDENDILREATETEQKGNLQVIVVESGTNTRLKGAKVVLDGSATGYTDSMGTYTFTGIKAGMHSLEVTLSGYEKVSRQGDVVSGETSIATIEMVKSDYKFQFQWGYEIDQVPDSGLYYTELQCEVIYGNKDIPSADKMVIDRLSNLRTITLSGDVRVVDVVRIHLINDTNGGSLKHWDIKNVGNGGVAKITIKVTDLVKRPTGPYQPI